MAQHRLSFDPLQRKRVKQDDVIKKYVGQFISFVLAYVLIKERSQSQPPRAALCFYNLLCFYSGIFMCKLKMYLKAGGGNSPDVNVLTC